MADSRRQILVCIKGAKILQCAGKHRSKKNNYNFPTYSCILTAVSYIFPNWGISSPKFSIFEKKIQQQFFRSLKFRGRVVPVPGRHWFRCNCKWLYFDPNWLIAEQRCVRQYFVHSFLALWNGSQCAVAFVDELVTWYDAASRCVDRGGHLATLDILNTTTVRFIISRRIPAKCLWLGLVKDYVYWTIPNSQ